MTAYLNAVFGVTDFRRPVDGAGEQRFRVKRDGREVAGENK
ncbi:MAG: hypothetical protein WBY93_05505 [Candidatus Binatus sp.]